MLGSPYLRKVKMIVRFCQTGGDNYVSYLAKLTQCLAILLETSLSVWLGRVFLMPHSVGVKR